MMLRSLVLVATTLTTTAAASAAGPASSEDVQATRAADAKTAALAFESAVDAHYDAISDGRPCAENGCKQKVVRELELDGGLRVELRSTETKFGAIHGIVFHAAGRWWAADPVDDVTSDDCGMGKCIRENLDDVSIDRTKDVLWVRLRVGVRIQRLAAHTSEHHDRDVVIACHISDQPSCASVPAGDAFDRGRATILARSKTVRVRDTSSGKHDEHIVF